MVISAVIPAANADTGTYMAPAHTGTSFTGNITIQANGTVNYSGSGSHVITRIGNNGYNFTGGIINGALTIERNYANFTGNGNRISYNSSSGISLIIENASNVVVSNLVINGTSGGVYIHNSNYSQLNRINVSSFSYALDIANNTHFIGITNSSFSDNFGTVATESAIWVGYNPTTRSYSGGNSSNILFFNDSIWMHGGSLSYTTYEYSAVVYSSNVTFNHMQTTGVSNTYGSGVEYVDFYFQSINSIVENSVLNNFYESIETSSSFNLTLRNNIMFNSTYLYPYDSNYITITDNIFTNLNIYLYYSENITITGNVFHNGTSDYGFIYSYYDYNNTIISNNRFLGNLNYSYGISISTYEPYYVTTMQNNSFDVNVTYNTPNSTLTMIYVVYGAILANNNSMRINAANLTESTSLYGIYFYGCPEVGLNENFINITTSSSPTYGVFLYSYYYAETASLYGNNITIRGTGMLSGIYEEGNVTPSNSVIDGNSVVLDSNSSATGMRMYATTNAVMDNNYVYLDAGAGSYAVYTNHSSNISISQNTLESGNSSNNDSGLFAYGSNDVSYHNNTVKGYAYSANLSNTRNMLLVGNYLNASRISIVMNSISGAMAYHNDFIGSIGPARITGGSALVFNASYPVGGNYWGPGAKEVDHFSGPSQNVTGPDGIGDVPYNVTSSLKDNYPLMKPWVRPVVEFKESGLGKGAVWSATFNGVKKTSDQNTISFDIFDATYGNYSYSISSIGGYTLNTQSGTYHYEGTSSILPADYEGIYSFQIQETGLPSGTSWSIDLNGTTHSTTGTVFTFQQTAGTLDTYSIYNTSLYYGNVTSGSFTLSGANGTIDVAFAHYSYITGNVTPGNATVSVGGRSVSVANGHFNLSVTAGTYDVKVTDSGYKTYYNNFTLGSGASRNLNVSLSKIQVSLQPSPKSASPINGYVLYGSIAAIIAIIAGTGYLFMFRRHKK